MLYLWVALAFVSQRPLLAGLVVLALWVAIDQAWLRRSSPWRWFQRRQAIGRLRARLEVNPHDRDARFQLAELLVTRGACDEAAALLQKNVDAGDGDVETLGLAGKAAYASTRVDGPELGERYLARAREKQPSFRSGAIDLELGRGRLAHGRHGAATEALRAAIEARPGSIEAHVLLARAHAAAGALDDANAARRKAWQLYRESPRFKRRQDRAWAWRAKPSAGITHYAIVGCGVAILVFVLPQLAPEYEYEQDIGEILEDSPQEDWNVAVDAAPAASRFTVTPHAAGRMAGASLQRWDLNRNGITDLRRKLFVGDLWCRITTHYPELADRADAMKFAVRDNEAGLDFGVAPHELSYFAIGAESGLHASALAFEALLESRLPEDCEARRERDGISEHFGVRDGEPFHVVAW